MLISTYVDLFSMSEMVMQTNISAYCTSKSAYRTSQHGHVRAHLVSVINKITSLLEYQGTLQFRDGLSFLKRLSQIILQA
jgi:hypothetical protein